MTSELDIFVDCVYMDDQEPAKPRRLDQAECVHIVRARTAWMSKSSAFRSCKSVLQFGGNHYPRLLHFPS